MNERFIEGIATHNFLEFISETIDSRAVHEVLRRERIRFRRTLSFVRYKKDKRECRRRRTVQKIRNYERTIEQYDEDTFYEHFRMDRVCFSKLETEVQPAWKTATRGRPPIPVNFALYATLWYLGNQNCFREISDRFGISKGTAYYIVLKCCKVLCNMKKKYIVWPEGAEAEDVIANFNNLRGQTSFPNVIGCIDGMHIEIPAPNTDAISYFNRKGYYSLILQAVCDSNFIFRDVFFGWPGSSHDAYVWQNSPIGRALSERCLKLPNDSHLIGDSAYSLSSYLLVPYKDNGFLSQAEKIFNQRHSSSRVCIEQAFGILKSKFRSLIKVKTKNLKHAKYFVLSCVILHNFLRKNSICNINEHFLGTLCTDSSNEEEVENANRDNVEGRIKRQVITEWLLQPINL